MMLPFDRHTEHASRCPARGAAECGPIHLCGFECPLKTLLLCLHACSCCRVSIVRELHVYGSAVAVHARDTGKLQHQGYGSLLMAAAERIALQEHRSTKMAVISGVGTRHYYRYCCLCCSCET